jgi:hypothetical protein
VSISPQTLERISRDRQSRSLLVVRGIDPEVYSVYLQKFFSNHRAVQNLHSAPVMTPEILEIASRELTLTGQDVSNLKALAR